MADSFDFRHSGGQFVGDFSIGQDALSHGHFGDVVLKESFVMEEVREMQRVLGGVRAVVSAHSVPNFHVFSKSNWNLNFID